MSSSRARWPSRATSWNAASSRARRLRSLVSALVLATLAGLLVAWMGGTAGGEVWVGYQTAAAPVLGALLAGARSVRPAAPVRTAGSAA